MQSGSHRRYRTALVLIALALGLSAPALAQNVERGHELFDLCASCHGPQGQGNELYLAPNIAGLPVWYIEGQLTKFRDGGRGMHFDDHQGMRMRPMAMSVPVLAIQLVRLGLSGRIEKHRRLARIAWPIWLYVSLTGVLIYALLYVWNPAPT